MSPRSHDRDDHLGDALADLPVPDHGPTFWADLDHRLQGEATVPQPTGSATDAGPETTPSARPLSRRPGRPDPEPPRR